MAVSFRSRSGERFSCYVMLFMAATVLLTGCRKPGKPPGKGQILRQMGRDLGLDRSQQAELERSIRRIEKADHAIHRARPEHMEDMIATVRREKVSLEEARALDARMETLHQEARMVLLEEMVRLHGLLTAEQRQKLADRLQAVHEKRLQEHPPPRGPPEGSHPF